MYTLKASSRSFIRAIRTAESTGRLNIEGAFVHARQVHLSEILGREQPGQPVADGRHDVCGFGNSGHRERPQRRKAAAGSIRMTRRNGSSEPSTAITAVAAAIAASIGGVIATVTSPIRSPMRNCAP